MTNRYALIFAAACAAMAAPAALAGDEPQYKGKTLLQWVKSTDADAYDAIRALAPKSEKSIPALIDLLKDEFRTQLKASSALAAMGQKALPALRRAAESDDAIVRAATAGTLSRIDEAADEDLLPPLRKLFQDRDMKVRHAAAEALVELERLDKDVLEFLFTELKQGDRRYLAISSISRCGPAAMPALPTLLELLKSDQEVLRPAAIDAISNIGPDAAEAVPTLIKLLDDADEFDRKHAARALGEIGPK